MRTTARPQSGRGAIAGLALGGLATMKFAFRDPQKFAGPNVDLHENDLLVKSGFVSSPLELRDDL